MPTKRPRHTITETDAVATALRRCRPLRPTARDSELIAELVVLGADALVRPETESANSAARGEARKRLVDRLRRDDGIDREALSEARSAWASSA